MAFLKQFRAFAVRGNMLDLAVGIIIGGAFQRIISSAVGDVLMPPLGLLIGGIDFHNIIWRLQPLEVDDAGRVLRPEVAIHLGNFLQAILDFLIIAFVVFLLVRFLTRLKLSSGNLDEVPPQEKLLTEIRDLLKQERQPPPTA